MAGAPTQSGQGRRGRRWLGAGLAAFGLIAGWLFAAATLLDRDATLEQAWTEAENTAALLAQHADRILRLAEITAERVTELVQQHGLASLAGAQQPRLAALAQGAPEIARLWLVDAAGRVVAGSDGAAGLDIAARADFAALRDGTGQHVSQMLQATDQGWFFTWSHPLRTADGRFDGAVVATIASTQLEGVAAGLALGPGATLRLARPDGAIVMAWPLPQAAEPAPAPLPGPAGRREEVAADGRSRLSAWRAAPGGTVLASAALARDHVLAPFRARLLRDSLLVGLAAVLAGLLAAVALRAAERERLARRAAEEHGAALAVALAEREDLLGSVQEGEARLRLAEQAGGIGLWDWDLRDGRLSLIGDAYAAWGIGPRRRLGTRAALRGVLAEDRPALAASLAAAVREETPLEAEFRLAHAGPAPGSERWIGVRAAIRRGVDGRPRRMLGIALDVTARRREAQALAEAKATLERRVAERTFALADANARLREGEARFRGIFDATFEFVGLLSPDGTVLEANAAMLRLAGVTAPAVLGRPYRDAPWWPEDQRAAVQDAIAHAAEGRFMRREMTMRGADGAARAVDFSITPIRDEDGLVSLLVPEARDITALKVTQAQLLEAQKMETLGRLTGGVAHDFNNLLMAVLGNLALARKRIGVEVEPRVLRHLDAATQGAERGAQLTQRLLAFARRQDLKPCAVDLARLLAGMRDLLHRSAGAMVRVTIEAPPGLPAALVDPHALELALMNLVVNARDAMPEGGEVSVQAAEAAPPPGLEPGRYLRIAVTDTGHGMDAETLARAIEPFFSTKQPGQGTGLGLSMVHGLAHQSGGALLIDSRPGAGTACVLWLPVATEEPADIETRREAEAPRGSGRVLLVDDEPLVLQGTAAMIEDLGYEVVSAGSGPAALALLEAGEAPDVVVTDHAMPDMTGAALAERIKGLRPGLPVILATGHAGPWPETEGPPRLAKPYSLAQLAEALARAVARRAAA